MKTKIEVGKTYKDQDGKRVYDVEVEGKTVEGIKAIALNESKCRRCKNYSYKCNRACVARTFDCDKNVQTLKGIFNFITSVILCVAIISIFSQQLAFFTKIGLSILSFVGMDIISSFIEKIVPNIYEGFYYRKLKRIKARNERLEEASRKKEEALKQKEEAIKIASAPNYQKVIAAKAIVQKLRELSEQYNYGSNEEKINICVEKCEAILQKLQEDSSGYIRVIYLFEAYLPEFCNALELYTNFVKADIVTQSHEETLTECVDTILEFLESQRIKAILDKASVEIKFDASASALKDMLQKEIDKEESAK